MFTGHHSYSVYSESNREEDLKNKKAGENI